MYDHEAKLDDWGESMIALARNGYQFAEYAAFQLLRETSRSDVDWEVRYWMIRSALGRQDARTVRIYVNDWKHARHRPSAPVSKWIPGDHYYVLNEKFDTLDEARDHLCNRGYRYEGLIEKHVYTRDGD